MGALTSRSSRIVPALIVAAVFFLAESPALADISCGSVTCTCKGDAECNDMFTNRCSDAPATCKDNNNGETSCTCFKKPSTATGSGKAKPGKVEGIKGVK